MRERGCKSEGKGEVCQWGKGRGRNVEINLVVNDDRERVGVSVWGVRGLGVLGG